jgi:DNA-binding NarL/FixJ family response regulator
MWKGDQWMGYDWRNPYSKKNYEARQRRLELARAAAKLRRRSGRHAPALSRGSLDFRGFRWLCPHCGRAVNVLFLPLPPINLLAELVPPLKKFDATTPIKWRSEVRSQKSEPNAGRASRAQCRSDLPSDLCPLTSDLSCFACERCHKVRRFSRCDLNGWNEIITYLTAGLLYGREVKRPDWFPHAKRGCLQSQIHSVEPAPPDNPKSKIGDRKIAYTPRPNREPSKRRPQIEKLLLSGRTFRQIASALSLSKGTILWYAQQVYKQHGVRSLRELFTQHGHSPPPPKREQVRQRLAEGQTVAQIAREMRISAMSVYNHIYMLSRTGAIAGRRTTSMAPSTAPLPAR